MKTKKQFFKEKIESVTYTVWDKEFKLAKSRQVREGVRQDRDRAIEAINNIEAKMKTTKGKEAKELQSERDHMVNTKERYEAQIDMVDKQINGFQGDQTHEPIIGILEELGSLHELKGMYKSYISSI